jgi:hypothetical protein
MARKRSRGSALAMLVLILAGLATVFFFAGSAYIAAGKLASRAFDQSAFDALHDALTNYVLLNKRLPCPAASALTGLGDPETTCPAQAGPVPWATLGLQQSAATDKFGRLYGYRVFDGPTGFTRSNSFALSDCLEQDDTTIWPLSGDACNATTHENTLGDYLANRGMTVNDRGAAKSQIAYVLLTHGPSGYGAHLPGSATPLTSPTEGSKEKINAAGSATQEYWVLEARTDVAPDNIAHFDDTLSYRSSRDLVLATRLMGRAWQFSARLDGAALGMAAGTFNLGAGSGTAALTGSAMTITTEDAARYICRVTGTPEGIAPCLTGANAGTDKLTTAGDEKLVFQFRLKRRYLKLMLADFRTPAGKTEKARLTFYNGATQVDEKTKDACSASGAHGAYFMIDPGADFDRVEIRADGSSEPTTDFSVAAIAACKSNSATSCFLREIDTPYNNCP